MGDDDLFSVFQATTYLGMCIGIKLEFGKLAIIKNLKMDSSTWCVKKLLMAMMHQYGEDAHSTG